MSVIRYGDLNVEMVDNHGVLISRLSQRQAPIDAFSPRPPAVPRSLPVSGREEQVADAFRAIEQGRPVEFHAGCGYGKTTLLQHIAAVAAERRPTFTCVYVRADGDRVEDLLHQLVTELYDSAQPVKLTPAECAHLLRQRRLIVAVDDAPTDPAQVGYLLDVLPDCRFVLGCGTRIPVRGGSSHDLPGLPSDAALELLASDLGRPLTSQELPAGRQLAAAVGGQPLHLRQAAALVREGSHSLASLARQAADDPAVLDRLSISSLTDGERRALAVLACCAGALLPAEIVDVIGQAAQLGECLRALHNKGLAEQRHDRFGLPACKAASYRALLLGDVQLGSAAGALTNWLVTQHPSSDESQSAVEAVLAILEFAAERREWTTVVQLARIADQILFIAERWEAWRHVLSQGLSAANATQASAWQAFFCHQLGSLELCLGRLDDAARLLQHALAVRERLGDQAGAELTRQNIQLLGMPAPPSPPARDSPPAPLPRRRGRVPLRVALVTALTAAGLIVAAVALAAVVLPKPPAPTPTLTLHPTASASLATTPQATATSTTPSPPPPTSPPPASPSVTVTVIVPNVVGLSEQSAATTLQVDGLAATTATTSKCDTASSGDVLSQNPVANTVVDKGSSVTLSVCSPPPPVTMPNVVGMTQQGATATLENDGLTVSAGTTSDCGKFGDGIVVTQSPLAGTSVPASTSAAIGICDVTPVP